MMVSRPQKGSADCIANIAPSASESRHYEGSNDGPLHTTSETICAVAPAGCSSVNVKAGSVSCSNFLDNVEKCEPLQAVKLFKKKKPQV